MNGISRDSTTENSDRSHVLASESRGSERSRLVKK